MKQGFKSAYCGQCFYWLIVMFVALAASLAFIPSQAMADEVVYEGRCGETSTWNCTDGVLTITGTGAVVAKGYNDGYMAPGNFVAYGFGAGSGYIYMQHVVEEIVVGEGITSLEADLFKSYRLVKKITLPSTLTEIGPRAFMGCRNLESLTFSTKSKLANIDEKVFFDCRNLKSVTLPASIKSVGKSAFGDCSGLKNVTTAKKSKLTTIDEKAFSGCSDLKTFNLKTSTSFSKLASDAFDKGVISSKVSKTTVKKSRKLGLRWSKTFGATKYILYYKPSGSSKYAKKAFTGTTATLTKLTKGKKYKVYVEAYLGKVKLCKSPVKTTDKIK